jgi:protein SERAC1
LLSRSGHAAIKAIAKCTRYIAFLGTPHAGSSKAAWGERGRKFVEYVGLQSNKELVKNLDSNSEVLASLEREFPVYLEDRLRERQEIEVMCFFEGTNFRIAGKSVGKVSQYCSSAGCVTYLRCLPDCA